MSRRTSRGWERSSERGSVRPGEGQPSPDSAAPSPRSPPATRPSPIREREGVGASAFALLTGCAARRERIPYADFADQLELGSPRGLGWLLTPLLEWCCANGHPPLPIIVVRRADGLPSGGYDPDAIAPETERVFDFDWRAVAPPAASDLNRYATPRLPAALRGARPLAGASPC